MTDICEIWVEEQLDHTWSHRFEGLLLSHGKPGTTKLAGPIRDQAELHGLLLRIRDLGLTLISVQITRDETPDHGLALPENGGSS